jgi:hypothetical protein
VAGRYGNTDNGVVTVTTLWADECGYYPVHAVPYIPAQHFAHACLLFVMALKPRRGMWGLRPDAHIPVAAARTLAWDGPDDPED